MQGKGLGLVFIAAVFIAAWLDHGLAKLVGGIVLAFSVTCSCKVFDRSPNSIYSHKMRAMRKQMQELHKQVQKIDDKHKDLRKQQEAGLKQDLAALAQKEVEDYKGRFDIGLFAGLGAFLCPLFGVAWLIGAGIRMLTASYRAWQEDKAVPLYRAEEG